MQQIFLVIFGLFSLLFSGCSVAPKPLMHQPACDKGIYAIKGSQCLDNDRLIERLERYDVIFIGDHHTEKEPHTFTATLIESLHASGFTIHLANEWFVPEDRTVLQHYMQEGYDGNFTEEIGWEKKAGYDFSQYEPIYDAVRESGGALYGINLTKVSRKKISDANLTGMSSEERTFFDGLDLNVSAHRQLLDPYFSHCHGLRKGEDAATCKERMYRVQVAWDTKMAQESAKLVEQVLQEPKAKLLIFVGAMHLSDDLGVNMRFSRLSNLPYVTILPEISSQTGYPNAEADYLFLYTPPESPL